MKAFVTLVFTFFLLDIVHSSSMKVEIFTAQDEMELEEAEQLTRLKKGMGRME